MEDLFEKQILDLYLGWQDTEAMTYRVLFYNFTVVSVSTFEELEEVLNRKYEATYEQNPHLATETNFGIIAEFRYEKVEYGSEEAMLFTELMSSTKDPRDIQAKIMKQ
jgi:hypothetical protein